MQHSFFKSTSRIIIFYIIIFIDSRALLKECLILVSYRLIILFWSQFIKFMFRELGEKRQKLKSFRAQTQAYEDPQNSRPKGKWAKQERPKVVFERRKKQWVSVPEYEEISRDSGLNNVIKELKKLFLQKKQNWGQIVSQTYLYDKIRPMIALKFTYKDSSLTRQPQKQKVLNLSELARFVPKLKHKYEGIRKIFDQLYVAVDPAYNKLAKFGTYKLKDTSKQNRQKYLQNIQKDQFLFYYKQDNKRIYFVVIDKQLNVVEFVSSFVQSCKQKLKEEYKLFEYFNKVSLKVEANQETTNSIFNKQEAQSDQETHNYGKNRNTLQNLRFKLEQALENTEYDMFERQIESSEVKQPQCKQEKKVSVNEKRKALKAVKALKTAIKLKLQALKNAKQDTFQFYQKNLIKLLIAQRQSTSLLPILKNKGLILEKITNQSLVIIEGQTGSGKSTQLPQLLLQYFNLLDDYKGKPILVTQPRRLSTRSLAERPKSGVKQCPNCHMGIYKTEGCNHMTCSRCKSHICWICLQLFQTAKKCYDHLFDIHGGIND